MVNMKILLLMLLVPCQLLGQDFTGIWTGFISAKQSRFPFELAISGEKDDLSGYSLIVFIIDDIEHTGIKTIKIKSKKSFISIEDDELIFEDYKIASKKVTLYGKLSFVAGSTTVLEGTFFTRAMDRTSYNGTIRLEKKNDFSKTKLITHLEKLNLLSGLSFLKPKAPNEESKTISNTEITNESAPPAKLIPPGELMTPHTLKEGQVQVSIPVNTKPELSTKPVSIQAADNAINTFKNSITTFKAAADIAARKTEILRTIYFQSDSLVLSLYDNGEIDGDTVSVLVNDNIVIAEKGLSATAIRTTVYIPTGFTGSLQVLMYAENLGRIAPNTGLLIVEDGNDKYQIRFEGDLQKNSAVIFRRKGDTDN